MTMPQGTEASRFWARCELSRFWLAQTHPEHKGHAGQMSQNRGGKAQNHALSAAATPIQVVERAYDPYCLPQWPYSIGSIRESHP